MYPTSLEKLIESFRLLPGVGAKSAERYALCMMDASEEDVEAFAKALLDIKAKLKTCPVCGNLTEEEKCSICSDDSRDHSTICVVQSIKDVVAMEKTNEYKAEAIEKLNVLLKDYPHIELVVLPTRYPQGAEKQLIQSITGRQVPPGGLPAVVGCAVFNAATTAAIYDAVYLGMPLVRRGVTVTGRAIASPKNFIVPIGTSFEALINAGGLKENPYKVLTGGPMMGIAQFDWSVPVIKGTNAVTVFAEADKIEVENPRCIRCGRCMDVCPMHLMPLKLYQAERKSDIDKMNALNLMDCIECGCCAYTCPGKLHLVQSFRTGKQKLRDAAAKAKG